MISRNFYFQVVFRIVIMVLTTAFVVFLLFKQKYGWSILLFLLLFFQIITLINYINSTNKRIAYFFDSIKNEDFTLRFSEENKAKSFNELHKSLNGLNAKIQQVYIKNQAQEKYYQEIIKQAEIGILTMNKKGHILISNPNVEKLLNYSPLNHINQLKYINSELNETIASLKPFDRKLIQLSTERGRKQLSIKSSSLILNNEELLLVIIQDIHKELEDKEAESWLKLIQVLTHEIMNTITPVTSISNSILNYYTNDTAKLNTTQFNNTIKGLKVIHEQSNSLMEFVTSYRSFLNIPKPNKKIVLANELIHKIVLMMEQDDIEFLVHTKPNELELFVDEVQLKLVLINLIKNSIQSLKKTKNKKIEINAEINTRNEKFIKIKDNGSGIKPELLDKIFVPFFTTKTDGSGIGLSLSKQIIRLHGGNIDVYSEVNNGTVIKIVFK